MMSRLRPFRSHRPQVEDQADALPDLISTLATWIVLGQLPCSADTVRELLDDVRNLDSDRSDRCIGVRHLL